MLGRGDSLSSMCELLKGVELRCSGCSKGVELVTRLLGICVVLEMKSCSSQWALALGVREGRLFDIPRVMECNIPWLL